MSEPIEFQILENVQTALRGISTTSGYYSDIVDEAVKLDPDVDAETLRGRQSMWPFIFLQPMPEEWIYEGMPNGLRLEWPLKIHWVNDTDGTDDAAKARAFFRGCADVERAITRDISRGGLAIDHRIRTRAFNLSDDGTVVWAEIDTVIRVRRTYGTP